MSTRKPRKRKHSQDEPVIEENADENNEMEEELTWSDEEGTTVDGIYIPPPIKPSACLNTSTRLIITKITNNFFKSYAKNVVLGPYSKCFNAIVGPNGSGKSNVIDSMLFVFGYRATKLRSKKLSVLLHNSDKYRNVQSCTVSVHFCEIVDMPGKNYKVVPGSEFVVSRTANKDNSSFYELNSKRVHFKEVARLLKKHGIDLDHNRFLILQGEVEEIAMMKCKGQNENETGMLEYLEDIIGTNIYKKPLEQLTERIENLSVTRSEKLNRLKLIEKELEDLQKPMEEAVNFLKEENQVATCKNFLYQRQIYELEAKIEEIETDKRVATEHRDELNNRLQNLAAEKSEKEKKLKQESAKFDKLQQRKDELKEAFNAADKKDMQMQAEMVQMNNNRKKYKEQLAEEKKKFEQLERVPEANRKTIVECENKMAELTAKREKLQEEMTKALATYRDGTKELVADKEKLETELNRLKKTVDSTKSAYELADSELKLAQSKEENEKKKLEELRESLKTTEATIKQRSEEVAQLGKKIPATEKSLNDALRELQNNRNEEARINSQIKEKKMNLEETRSSMQMSKSRGHVLDALMQQKVEGNCPGLYGRLGDLGGIDGKYDVAISTACGPLDNIVVDTVNTAQWCIEFLKKHGLGRATFIALDKQEHLREAANGKIRTPENVHRLFDLVQIRDEDVKTAFYFALRDTLVANDLDQATRIAYGAQRYRVVTLKGDLIEISGTMSGGGRTVSRGRMGRSVVATTINPQEIEQMEAALRKSEDRLRALLQNQATLEGQVNTLQPELNQMKINYEKFSQVQELRAQVALLAQQLRKQENVVKSTKADPKQIAKLTAVVESKRDEFEEASAAAQEIRSEVEQLDKEIKEKTSGKTASIKKSLAECTKTIDKNKAEITRLRVAITTSERNAKKSAAKIESLEQDIVDAENRMRELKSERETIEKDGQKLLRCIEEITEQIANGEEDYAELKQQVAASSKEESKLNLKRVDVEHTFKVISEKLAEAKGHHRQWHAKLAQLKLHEIPHETTPELVKYSAEEVKAKNAEQFELELQNAQNNIKSMNPNLNIIQEYRQGQEIYMTRTQELEAVTNKRNEIKNLFDKVTNQRKDEFMVGYNIIKLKLKEMYQMITLGGDADFEIVDSFDPFSDGIQFNVRPPRKSWKSISNLSGGEKTLSSLALVFALHYYKPSPLYVMDEIDAALDFKNVSIVGHYIKERTKNAQFIIISLRSNMFELCDNLIGIYKIFDCTKTITIDPNSFNSDKQGDDQVVPVEENINQEHESLENGNEDVEMEEVSGVVPLEEKMKEVVQDVEMREVGRNGSLSTFQSDNSFNAPIFQVFK